MTAAPLEEEGFEAAPDLGRPAETTAEDSAAEAAAVEEDATGPREASFCTAVSGPRWLTKYGSYFVNQPLFS